MSTSLSSPSATWITSSIKPPPIFCSSSSILIHVRPCIGYQSRVTYCSAVSCGSGSNSTFIDSSPPWCSLNISFTI